MPEGVGHEGQFDGIPAEVITVGIVVKVDRGQRVGIAEVKTSRNATKSLDGAEEWVVVGAVANLLASHSILLVKERQRSMGDALDRVPVIQRCRGANKDGAVNGEVDVTEAEGLGPSLRVGEQVFGRSEEPEERDDDEVDDVGVEHSKDGVRGVEGLAKALDNGDVGGVGPGSWVVFIGEALEERRE